MAMPFSDVQTSLKPSDLQIVTDLLALCREFGARGDWQEEWDDESPTYAYDAIDDQHRMDLEFSILVSVTPNIEPSATKIAVCMNTVMLFCAAGVDGNEWRIMLVDPPTRDARAFFQEREVLADAVRRHAEKLEQVATFSRDQVLTLARDYLQWQTR